MPVVDVINIKKETVGQVELSDQIYNVELRPHLVHEVVTAQLHSRRAGTACTKGRSDVNGSGKKPYRQKGTGRARAGSRKSPIWRGGGVVFGPKPRDFSWRPPIKVRRAALKVVLSAKLRDQELFILDELVLAAAKTKEFAQVMKSLSLDKAVLVTPGEDSSLERSARNLPGVKILRADGLNCYDLLKYQHLVLLKESLPKIEERLLK